MSTKENAGQAAIQAAKKSVADFCEKNPQFPKDQPADDVTDAAYLAALYAGVEIDPRFSSSEARDIAEKAVEDAGLLPY